jgi:hypothetical protein
VGFNAVHYADMIASVIERYRQSRLNQKLIFERVSVRTDTAEVAECRAAAFTDARNEALIPVNLNLRLTDAGDGCSSSSSCAWKPDGYRP